MARLFLQYLAMAIINNEILPYSILFFTRRFKIFPYAKVPHTLPHILKCRQSGNISPNLVTLE